MTSATRKIDNAIYAIDSAETALKRAQRYCGPGEADTYVRRAIRELEDAKSEVERARREVRALER